MSDPNNKLALVTGASGFVGNNVVRQLLAAGRRVRALAGSNRLSLRGLDIEIVEADVRCVADLERAVQDVDVVYHLAGLVPLDSSPKTQTLLHEINVVGTKNVVQSCLKSDVRRLVHCSSIHALSHLPGDQPIDETRGPAKDLRYHRPYDLSKACGETEVLTAVADGLDAVIINPVGILGPNDFRPSPSGLMLWQLANRQLPGLVQTGYHWIDVRDVAQAALLAEEHGRTGERYILSGEFVSFYQLAQWVYEETGARPPLLNAPVWLARGIAPFVAWFSRLTGVSPLFTPDTIKVVAFQNDVQTSKARDELGLQPRPMETAVKESVRWLQKLMRERRKETGSTHPNAKRNIYE